MTTTIETVYCDGRAYDVLEEIALGPHLLAHTDLKRALIVQLQSPRAKRQYLLYVYKNGESFRLAPQGWTAPVEV